MLILRSFYTWLAKQNAIQLSPKDIYLLRPDKLLNDNIIDFYMKFVFSIICSS